MRLFFLNIKNADESFIRRLSSMTYISSTAKCFYALKSDDLLCIAFEDHVRYVASFDTLHSLKTGTSLIFDGIARCDFFLEEAMRIPESRVQVHFPKQRIPTLCRAKLGMIDVPVVDETEEGDTT